MKTTPSSARSFRLQLWPSPPSRPSPIVLADNPAPLSNLPRRSWEVSSVPLIAALKRSSLLCDFGCSSRASAIIPAAVAGETAVIPSSLVALTCEPVGAPTAVLASSLGEIGVPSSPKACSNDSRVTDHRQEHGGRGQQGGQTNTDGAARGKQSPYRRCIDNVTPRNEHDAISTALRGTLTAPVWRHRTRGLGAVDTLAATGLPQGVLRPPPA